MDSSAYSTRRARDVNYGDRTPITGDGRPGTLAWISVDESQPFTVYVQARLEGPAADVARALVLASVEWGNGGASVSTEYPVVKRLRVPLAASMIRISGRLVDADGASPPPRSVVAEVSAFIAKGLDGETLRNTRWIAQSGAHGVLVTGQQKLLNLEGYSAQSAAHWIMVFDATAIPTNGAFPAMAAPVTASGFRLTRFDTRDFRTGIAWAASTSPMSLTLDGAAMLRVDGEVLL